MAWNSGIKLSIDSFQSGDTPLHLASREGLLAVSQSLCAFGCSVELFNNEGQQPIHLAAKNGHTEVGRRSSFLLPWVRKLLPFPSFRW